MSLCTYRCIRNPPQTLAKNVCFGGAQTPQSDGSTGHVVAGSSARIEAQSVPEASFVLRCTPLGGSVAHSGNQRGLHDVSKLPALALYPFCNAFPTVSQEWLFCVLRALTVPPALVFLFISLYPKIFAYSSGLGDGSFLF